MSGYSDFIDRLLLNPDLLGKLTPAEPQGWELPGKIRDASDETISGGREIADGKMFALVRGALHCAVDALDAAHRIFQDDSSDLGSYWHGVMHRREGDFDNARYWFRRAGRLPIFAKCMRLPLTSPRRWRSRRHGTPTCSRACASRQNSAIRMWSLSACGFSALSLINCSYTAGGRVFRSLRRKGFQRHRGRQRDFVANFFPQRTGWHSGAKIPDRHIVATAGTHFRGVGCPVSKELIVFLFHDLNKTPSSRVLSPRK